MSYDYLFRIIVIGDAGVGKSSIIHRLNNENLTKDYLPTIGIDFALNQNIICDQRIKTQIWDTAGQEYFRSIIRNYYNDVCGAILVYDITNKHSFERISWWLNELNNFKNSVQMPNLILIGNKIDKNNRVVSYQEGNDLAKKNEMMFFETSALTDIEIKKFFERFLVRIYKNMPNFNHGIKKHVRQKNFIEFSAKKKKCCVSF